MPESLTFALKYFRGYIFREWLRGCRDRGFAHGSELVEMLGTPRDGKPGLADNVNAADQLLRAATEEGWILQGAARVDHTVAGISQDLFLRLERGGSKPILRYPREHGYGFNRENEAAARFLESEES